MWYGLNEIWESLHPTDSCVAKPGSSSSISFLDAEEELALVKVYVSKVPALCEYFRFPEEVEATSVSYLKRFYLRNTVMDYHPKKVMCVHSTAV